MDSYMDGDLQAQVDTLADALAIMAEGDTHVAIPAGYFVYVRNHSTLADGLYTANSAIAANATLTTSNLTAEPGGLGSAVASLNSKITSMIEYGNCTYEQNWRGANDRYLRYSIIKDANGHGVCIINGLADNKQYITGGAAYTVSILPVTSLRDAVAFTNMGKWSIAHGSNELKFTPTSDMEAFLGDLMSISFAI